VGSAEAKSWAGRNWIYFLPALHLFACLISMIGLVVPGLESLERVWRYLMVADFPISLVALASGWRYGTIQVIWIVVVGTFWWFMWNRAIDVLVTKFRERGVPSIAGEGNSKG
jgi:hypothetical protein